MDFRIKVRFNSDCVRGKDQDVLWKVIPVRLIVMKGLYTSCGFSAIFNMGDNFCDFLFAFLSTRSLLKKSLL